MNHPKNPKLGHNKKTFLEKPIEHIDITSFDSRKIIDSMDKMSFTSRDTAKASGIFNEMLLDKNCSVFLTLAGSTSAAGCMKIYSDMIKYNMVDVIVATGASIIDIGAESTRPGSDPISYKQEIKKLSPNIKVEVLTPDFNGSVHLIKNVINAGPHVMNHNIETVRRVFKKVRPKGNYDLSLNFLSDSKKIKPDLPTKSGMMVGLGETKDEVIETMKDLRDHQCDLLTIGQYLRPSKKHHPIIKFYNPREFTEFQNIGLDMGFSHVAAGPLVRSSYHADEQHNAAVEKLINQIKS